MESHNDQLKRISTASISLSLSLFLSLSDSVYLAWVLWLRLLIHAQKE